MPPVVTPSKVGAPHAERIHEIREEVSEVGPLSSRGLGRVPCVQADLPTQPQPSSPLPPPPQPPSPHTMTGAAVAPSMDGDSWQASCTLLRQLSCGRFGTVALVRRGESSLVQRIVHRVTDLEDHWQAIRALRLHPHPNLEHLVKLFVCPEQIAIYAEHHGDLTLLDFIRSYFQPMIPETQVLRWLCHILDALHYLDLHGLQHGNLLAKNVLLVPGRSRLRLTNWTVHLFVRRQPTELRSDLECLGSILLVVITLNSALDGRRLPHDTVSSLLDEGRAYFSDFLLNITHDLISNSMESVAYLRGLMAAPDDMLYGSQPEIPALEGDLQRSQVDASPIHRRERARLLQQLAEEAAQASRGNEPKHPSTIVTFFNLFKLSARSWKRVLKRRVPYWKSESKWSVSTSSSPARPKLVRSVSCPSLFFRENISREVEVQEKVTG